ncbi:MAG: hypothetical protein ACRCW0_09185 [Clostridium sp.]
MSKINAKEIAKELNLYLKVVVSTKSFENYNAFYNIYGDSEEYCRRIAVLTPYAELEEVSDEDPNEKVKEKIFEGNLWIKEYPLTMNPAKIDLDTLMVDEKLVDEYKKLLG